MEGAAAREWQWEDADPTLKSGAAWHANCPPVDKLTVEALFSEDCPDTGKTKRDGRSLLRIQGRKSLSHGMAVPLPLPKVDKGWLGS